MLAVIRIRGRTGIRYDMDQTTRLLNLTRINHMVIIPSNETYKGMLQKVKDYVTWGEIEKDTLALLLKHRSQFKGRKHYTEEELKEKTGFTSYDEMAEALISGKVIYKDIEGIVPIFRLHPPRGGLEYVRKPYGQGGTGGYRASEINKLIKRMIVPGADLNGKNKN